MFNDQAVWGLIATHVLLLSNPLLLGLIFIRLGKLGQRMTDMEGRITRMETRKCLPNLS